MLGRFFISGLLVGCCLAALAAQAPKPPALPAINPAQARLDQTLGGLDGPCYSLVASDAAELLIAGGERGTLVAWPRSAWLGVRVGTAAPDLVPAHEGPITALAWGNGTALASAGADRKLRIWNMPKHDVKYTLETGATVRSLAISPDGKRLAAGDDANAIVIYDVDAGKPAGKLTGHADWVLTLAFSPDGTRLVSGSSDGQLVLWDVAAGKKLLDLQAAPPAPPNTPPAAPAMTALAFRADGKLLAAGNRAGQIHLIDPVSGKLLRSTAAPHGSAVSALAFHPGGTLLASASKDRTVKLWNPENGQLIINLDGHTAWVQGVAFLEKGTRLATVGADQTVRIWDLTPKK